MTRQLTQQQIETLTARGCTASDWATVRVCEGFDPSRMTNVNFSGDVKLGAFNSSITNEAGIVRPSGISNATLHNCSVGDNCLISGINNYIASYDIEANCVIENVNSISCEPSSRFGNGVRVAVLSETGGREVPIFNTLTSHLAYILAIYRYKQPIIKSLESLIDRHCESMQSDRGTIGHHSIIRNSGTIKSVRIAAHTIIDGAAELVDGSINSTEQAPVRVGVGVMAHHFIFSSGVIVDTSATLHNCFVGQGSIVRNLFSAHDSLIFSNCQFENGEACAIFAGPYTVSMHKSSLLIAGLYSFLNAGSGSNQSNHMYKLGPIHQGVVERGSKTTSDSYILWPAHIGAFSLVMGRHTSHPNTRNMPFSYLIERGDKTHLSPGVNLKSVGTIRDTIKWPKRDRRVGDSQLDLINFNLLSPFTVSRMMQGFSTLEDLKNLSGATSAEYAYQSTRISSSALMRGISLYGKAIDKFLGNSLVKRLENIKSGNSEELRAALAFDRSSPLNGDWIDLSGLIASSADVEAIFADTVSGKIDNLTDVEARFRQLHSTYYEREWQWAASAMEKWYDIKIDQITSKEILAIAGRWIDSVVSIDRMLAEDAHKEFSLVSRVGFGVDGTSTDAASDFDAVRGSAENNDFIRTINDHIAKKQALFDDLCKRIAIDN